MLFLALDYAVNVLRLCAEKEDAEKGLRRGAEREEAPPRLHLNTWRAANGWCIMLTLGKLQLRTELGGTSLSPQLGTDKGTTIAGSWPAWLTSSSRPGRGTQ